MPAPQLRLLVAESEPPGARAKRREAVGRTAGESFVDRLHRLAPGSAIEQAWPTDEDSDLPDAEALASFDGVFLTGSPLHVWKDTPEVRRELAFMRAIFASGTPSFGSCAGLQIAAAAAGGRVRAIGGPHEAGIARRIWATPEGARHPLLAGRPPCWDALAIHGDEVEALPDGATLLASNAACGVQAAEIRCDQGIFWGVQYHPELSLHEIAVALRRDADQLVKDGLALDRSGIEARAEAIDALDREPGRTDLLWSLGIDRQITDEGQRTTELRNFLEALVKPVHQQRRG